MTARWIRTGLLWASVLASIGGLVGRAHAATRLVPGEYPTIQPAIDASATGDTVLLDPGTYRGAGNRDIELRGRDLVVKSRTGPDGTIIDCEGAGRGFYIHEWETAAATVEGITIQNGIAPSPFAVGGGIYSSRASPTIRACRIENCRALDGGGISLGVTDSRVEGCVISGCVADSRGGGIHFEWGLPEITNCVISGNSATYGGGICFAGPGTNRLFHSTVTANFVTWDGGGVYAINPILLEQCIVWGNCGPDDRREELVARGGGATLRCCAIDTTGVVSYDPVEYDEYCVYTDPVFCGLAPCGQTTEGDWTLNDVSPCAPEHSPCGALIGALGVGCGLSLSTGACCLTDGSCVVVTLSACDDQHGIYQGDEAPCDPDPCQPTPVEAKSWGRIKVDYREAAD